MGTGGWILLVWFSSAFGMLLGFFLAALLSAGAERATEAVESGQKTKFF